MLEAWQLREKQGGEGALNPSHKKKRYHFTSPSGAHLQWVEDRCTAERIIAVTLAPRPYWNGCTLKAACPPLCSVIWKEVGLFSLFFVGPFSALTLDVSVMGGRTAVVGLVWCSLCKNTPRVGLLRSAAAVTWLIWAEPDCSLGPAIWNTV